MDPGRTEAVIRHFTAKKSLKGEDFSISEPECVWPLDAGEHGIRFGYHAVFDGHGGQGAALACKKDMLSALLGALDTHAAHTFRAAQTDLGRIEAMVGALGPALTDAFTAMDRSIAEVDDSGATATVVLTLAYRCRPPRASRTAAAAASSSSEDEASDDDDDDEDEDEAEASEALVVCANVGDSHAFCYSGGGPCVRLNGDHRLDANKAECDRVRAAGGTLDNQESRTEKGPLRLYPGGLMMSRTIGDRVALHLAIATPEVRIAYLPPSGGRVIIASDGLWDIISGKAAGKLVAGKAPQPASQLLVATAQKKNSLDDITVLVVDVLPWARRREKLPWSLPNGQPVANALLPETQDDFTTWRLGEAALGPGGGGGEGQGAAAAAEAAAKEGVAAWRAAAAKLRAARRRRERGGGSGGGGAAHAALLYGHASKAEAAAAVAESLRVSLPFASTLPPSPLLRGAAAHGSGSGGGGDFGEWPQDDDGFESFGLGGGRDDDDDDDDGWVVKPKKVNKKAEATALLADEAVDAIQELLVRDAAAAVDAELAAEAKAREKAEAAAARKAEKKRRQREKDKERRAAAQAAQAAQAAAATHREPPPPPPPPPPSQRKERLGGLNAADLRAAKQQNGGLGLGLGLGLGEEVIDAAALEASHGLGGGWGDVLQAPPFVDTGAASRRGAAGRGGVPLGGQPLRDPGPRGRGRGGGGYGPPTGGAGVGSAGAPIAMSPIVSPAKPPHHGSTLLPGGGGPPGFVLQPADDPTPPPVEENEIFFDAEGDDTPLPAAETTATLHVSRFGKGVGAAELRAAFAPHAQVLDVAMKEHAKFGGYAFVHVASARDAANAKAHLDGVVLSPQPNHHPGRPHRPEEGAAGLNGGSKGGLRVIDAKNPFHTASRAGAGGGGGGGTKPRPQPNKRPQGATHKKAGGKAKAGGHGSEGAGRGGKGKGSGRGGGASGGAGDGGTDAAGGKGEQRGAKGRNRAGGKGKGLWGAKAPPSPKPAGASPRS